MKLKNHVYSVSKKTGKTLLRFVFLLVLTGILVIFFPDELQKIVQELKNTSLQVLAAVLLLALLRFFLEGAIIRTAVGNSGETSITLKKGICCAFYCEFFRLFTLGTGSGIAEIYYLSENGLEPVRGTGISLIQYTLHKLAITLCGIVSLILCRQELHQSLDSRHGAVLGGCLLALAICAVILLAAACRPLSRFLFSLAEKPAQHLGGQWPEKLNRLEQQTELLQTESCLLLHEKKRLFGLFLLNLLKFGCLYMIPRATFPPGSISPEKSWALCALVYLLAGVIPAPSGYGSTEFLFLMLYSPFTGTARAGAAAVLLRIATSFFPAAIGGIIFLFQKKNTPDVRG